jgi:hypothetical protein
MTDQVINTPVVATTGVSLSPLTGGEIPAPARNAGARGYHGNSYGSRHGYGGANGQSHNHERILGALDRHRAEHGWAPGLVWNPYAGRYGPPQAGAWWSR